MSGEAFDTSELTEFGVKGQILKDKNLYFSLSFYEQERTDFSAQSTVTNQSVRTEGVEFELRWAVTDALFVGATYTDVEAINLNSVENGNPTVSMESTICPIFLQSYTLVECLEAP